MDTQQIISTIVIAIIVLIIYYAGTWHRRKQQKDQLEMQKKLKKGDKIVTFSGLSGVIEEVLDDRVIISCNPEKTKISIEKWAVAGLDERNIE